MALVSELTSYRLDFRKEDQAAAWLTSAHLARKSKFPHQSFNAVMHAYQLGAVSAKIEHSRLLWNEGQHRKAIQTLEGAIAANAFKSYNNAPTENSTSMGVPQQNILTAKVSLFASQCCWRNINNSIMLGVSATS